jgi:hypothetical protein
VAHVIGLPSFGNSCESEMSESGLPAGSAPAAKVKDSTPAAPAVANGKSTRREQTTCPQPAPSSSQENWREGKREVAAPVVVRGSGQVIHLPWIHSLLLLLQIWDPGPGVIAVEVGVRRKVVG